MLTIGSDGCDFPPCTEPSIVVKRVSLFFHRNGRKEKSIGSFFLGITKPRRLKKRSIHAVLIFLTFPFESKGKTRVKKERGLENSNETNERDKKNFISRSKTVLARRLQFSLRARKKCKKRNETSINDNSTPPF